MDEPTPHVGAVILTHGEHDSYKLIVGDLLEQGLAPEEICIVHNPVRATDRPVDPPPGAQAIRMPGNLGYANGMNAGMRHHLARGVDWIWLLTHDVRLRAGALPAMRSAARENPEFGALGPVLFIAGTDTVFSLGGERTRTGQPYVLGYNTPFTTPAAGIRPCAWLDGSSIMLRSETLAAVGLYDTSLFIYTEDALLCLHIERAGWRIGVVGDARAEQSAGHVSRPGPVAFLIARNNLRYARELGGPARVLPALSRQLRETVHLVRVAVTGPRRRMALIQCFTMWVGVLAFLAGRSGPPPRWLPGQGDIASA